MGREFLQVQEVVGDKLWMDMMQRKADRLYAVLKSLPLTPDAAAPSSSDGNQRAVAEALLAQVHPCVWSVSRAVDTQACRETLTRAIYFIYNILLNTPI